MKWVVIVSVVLLLSACLSLKNNIATQEIELILIPNVKIPSLDFETEFDIVLKSEDYISNPSGYIKSGSSSQLLEFTPLETPLSKTWMAKATIIPIDKVDVEVEYLLYGYLRRKSRKEFKADDSALSSIVVDATATYTTPVSTETTTTNVYVLIEANRTIVGVTGYIKAKNAIYELNFEPPASTTPSPFGTIWIAETKIATSDLQDPTPVAFIEYYTFIEYAYKRGRIEIEIRNH